MVKIIEFVSLSGFLFVLASISGWILELIFRSARDRRLTNPGLLRGPYLPIYGAAALILSIFYDPIHSLSLFLKFPVYLTVTTLYELLAGAIAEKVFGAKLWDYSDLKYQYRGFISLRYSVYWVILSFVFEYILYPGYMRFESLIPEMIRFWVTSIFISVMMIDSVFRILQSMTNEDVNEAELEREFDEYGSDILRHPEFIRLEDFKHHRETSRLTHVIEVAWHSFILAKKFSLDTRSAVRGALLHDFFHYDWLREGPRFHGFFHPGIAMKNAQDHFSLNRIEADIIKKHMWPLTPVPPLYRESLIVCLVDTVVSLQDYLRIHKDLSLNFILREYKGDLIPIKRSRFTNGTDIC